MYGKSLLRLASAVTLAMILAPQIAAGPPPPLTNTLYGFITSNRTLTYLSPGPAYYLVGDVIVSPGVTLTIEPGVTVVCNANGDTLQGGLYSNLVELSVQGSLVAVGTVTDSVRFVASDLGTARWGEIRVESGGSGSLSHASVQGALWGLRVYGHINASNCLISKVANGAEFRSASTGSFREVRLEGRGSGVGGEGIRLAGAVDTAPFDSTTPRPIVVSRFYTGVSIQEFGATLSHVVAFENAYGITTSFPSAQISYCTAVRNVVFGISVSAGSVYSSITTNNSGCGIEGSGQANYCDSWSNAPNFCSVVLGPSSASFNPFFVDYAGNDFQLAEGSIFKTYGPWGAEIGAYGPGPGMPVQSQATTWGRVKAERH